MKSKFSGGAIYFFSAVALLCVMLLFCAIVGGLFYSASEAGFAGVLSAFSAQWAPQEGKYGLLPMAAGTLAVSAFATLAAIPLSFGVLSCIWIYDNAASRFLRNLLRFMSGIPTVVYGFCGLFILIPLFRAVKGGSGYHMLAASVVLCLLILPTMTVTVDSALSALLDGAENPMFTAASVGLSREKSFLFVALYIQKKFIVMAVLLAFSRALGDTLISLMLSGNAPVMPEGLFSSVRTLPAHISLLASEEITPQIEFTLFLSGFLLFASALFISFAARALGRK